ncbi:hypothetical protein CRENPOLYSF2_900029 [Crenothrix polyspora]|uniref:Uncharacterized protein n=1 Tax=Crenothrix polyspora TaxID=360316 RepID=A0A1R4HJ17_9GAMM|nr:hypothetical protein CRENPOLYSF2_900029 [Crenothrix polyspora]
MGSVRQINYGCLEINQLNTFYKDDKST